MIPHEFDDELNRVLNQIPESKTDEHRARKAGLASELRRVYGAKSRELWGRIVSRVLDTWSGRGLPTLAEFREAERVVVTAAQAMADHHTKCGECKGLGMVETYWRWISRAMCYRAEAPCPTCRGRAPEHKDHVEITREEFEAWQAQDKAAREELERERRAHA